MVQVRGLLAAGLVSVLVVSAAAPAAAHAPVPKPLKQRKYKIEITGEGRESWHYHRDHGTGGDVCYREIREDVAANFEFGQKWTVKTPQFVFEGTELEPTKGHSVEGEGFFSGTSTGSHDETGCTEEQGDTHHVCKHTFSTAPDKDFWPRLESAFSKNLDGFRIIAKPPGYTVSNEPPTDPQYFTCTGFLDYSRYYGGDFDIVSVLKKGDVKKGDAPKPITFTEQDVGKTFGNARPNFHTTGSDITDYGAAIEFSHNLTLKGTISVKPAGKKN